MDAAEARKLAARKLIASHRRQIEREEKMGDYGLDLIRVNKAELLERVQHNRDQHRSVFEKAVEGYRSALLAELEARIERVRTGHVENMRIIQLVEPEDHTKDYDRIIDMLKMSVAEEIDITQQEFGWYVRDDWAWKGAFTASAGVYGVQA